MLAQTVTVGGELTGLLADMTVPDFDFTLFELVDAMAWLSFVAAAFPIGAWIYRAHAHLREAGFAVPGIGPGWAVGWFFVPIADFWKPYQVMRGLWRGSHHAAAVDPRSADGGPVAAWWGLWLSGIVFIVLPDHEAATAATLCADIACAGLLWRIIACITALQTRPGPRETFA